MRAFLPTGRDLPRVDPMPPAAPGRLPWIGSGPGLLANPTAFFERCRREVGETFLADAFGYRLLCTFSPAGVRSLWALPESRASKGLADYTLLSHKVPPELFRGRRVLPHVLFAADAVDAYVSNLRAAVDLELDDLGSSGRLEIFAFTRRLAHRVGLASWGGLESATPRYLERLARAFDRLDASESFVHPGRAFFTIATGRWVERRALRDIEAMIGEILRERHRSGRVRHDYLDRICEAWADVPNPEHALGVARDVAIIHMGSQSNLFAAMAWTMIHVLQRPELIERIRGGDAELLDQCANESIRLAQRSIVLRRALKEVELADERITYRVAPGAFLATMMSVTNTTSAEGLDRFDPSNYCGRSFARADDLRARELVTTFGHGRHACPAQRFSILAIRFSMGELLARFDLHPLFDRPRPRARQIGGVARSASPCFIDYEKRAPARGA